MTPTLLAAIHRSVVLVLTTISPAPASDARQVVRDAITAQGGETALRALSVVRIRGIEESYGIGFSPDVDHPRMFVSIFDELRDVRALRERRTTQSGSPSASEMSALRVVMSDSVGAWGRPDTVLGPAPAQYINLQRDKLALGPERLLLMLLDAPDVRAAGDTTIQGVPQHVVSIHQGNLRVYLSAVTHLPTLMDVYGPIPDDAEWDAWGDVHSRTWFTSWSLEQGGIRYPRTWTTERAGHLFNKVSVFSIDPHPVAPADSFAVSDDVRAKYVVHPPMILGNGRGQPVEMADGITWIPGRWATMVVRQPTGIVVIDSPYASEYSARVLDEVKRRYPGETVRALVVTDFMWAHFGGVREYVAHRVPVYANARNESVLRAVTSAKHVTHPDALSTSGQSLIFHPVAGVQHIGEGPNQIELIPVEVSGADYGRKIIVAYFPNRHLMWSSDLYSPGGEVNFAMQNASELAALIAQRGLTVDTIVGSHLRPTAWKTVESAVSARVTAVQ
jgi:hypothetical protein